MYDCASDCLFFVVVFSVNEKCSTDCLPFTGPSSPFRHTVSRAFNTIWMFEAYQLDQEAMRCFRSLFAVSKMLQSRPVYELKFNSGDQLEVTWSPDADGQ